jgi:NTP pyrophosphatase (non-canonical NTP hydrolase)
MRRDYPLTDPDDLPDDLRPYDSVHAERIRAHTKHGSFGDSMEQKEWTDPAWLSVLVEEVGEVARELCDHRHRQDANPEADRDAYAEHRERMREELVQVAAMAVAWIDSIDNDICSPVCALQNAHDGAHVGWDGAEWPVGSAAPPGTPGAPYDPQDTDVIRMTFGEWVDSYDDRHPPTPPTPAEAAAALLAAAPAYDGPWTDKEGNIRNGDDS